ncbi:N-acetylneuraminate lyase [uncultured Acetatifactor sp.]|jgi:N-acetylneuraminate lyase|uniref:N-acetylneuraminate lyase n=1 Tax=uncultured Acetatifactor sp. TaxID=1671927 RepID=UPI00262F9FCE|nr:N-acetylneuraminate lyase [uncultured Acetatifactor sp.]MCI8695402.1 N-acetylneuraminate lyase [Lachnospiraceae bacterium]
MNEKFKGIFPALLTPFDGQDRVDTEVLGRLVDYNLQKGVDGFYVAGSTAEVFLLDAKERLAVMEAVSSRAGGKCTLIAHIGCISTKQAIEYAREAKEMGYDAISSVAPFYYKFSFEEIRRYYFDIVDAVDLPMLIYNFPAFSGVNLTTDNIREFLADDRFLGVKHTSSDFYALEQFKAGFPDKVVYNGYDEMFLAGLSMGADGGIGSTFNFMAEKYIEIRRLFQENDMSAAQALQREVNTILRALVEVGVMQGEKAIMEGLGFPLGQARSPFAPLSGAQKEKLLRLALPTLQTAV